MRNKRITPVLILLLVGLLGVVGCGEHYKERRQIRDLVNNWLEDQRCGGYGDGYWGNYDYTDVTSLYNITYWEIVDLKFDSRYPEAPPTDATVTVRIDSSTKNGLEVRKIWDVKVHYTDDDFYSEWQISKMNEVVDE